MVCSGSNNFNGSKSNGMFQSSLGSFRSLDRRLSRTATCVNNKKRFTHSNLTITNDNRGALLNRKFTRMGIDGKKGLMSCVHCKMQKHRLSVRGAVPSARNLIDYPEPKRSEVLDILDGGPGTDTAKFTGKRENYKFSINDVGQLVVTDNVGDEGSDTLTNIDKLSFGDGEEKSELRVEFNGDSYHNDEYCGSCRR